MDTGDVVLHRPTGETWVVAYVDGEWLAWCGWPEGLAAVKDCEPISLATPDRRLDLLREMAAMSEPDSRRTYARARLAAAEEISKELCL